MVVMMVMVVVMMKFAHNFITLLFCLQNYY